MLCVEKNAFTLQSYLYIYGEKKCFDGDYGNIQNVTCVIDAYITCFLQIQR